jgi:hypothetical protein
MQNNDSKISIILDAWTSSNGHAFLAIVARYVNDDFDLGMYDLILHVICLSFICV